jgi:MEKHLA domain
MTEDIWTQPNIVLWSQILLDSYEKLLQKPLMARNGTLQQQARALFYAPFVVVSHGTESDPILNYGNLISLDLWEMSWGDLIRTPSRLTAEPMNRQEREQMLDRVGKQGFIDNYCGIRISKTGRRFAIASATVWNLTNAQGIACGQAATFSQWTFLP